MALRKKIQTSAQALRLFRSLLQELSEKDFAFPNSDYLEYCSCGHSPYNVPQHKEGCMTVRIHEALCTPIRDKQPRKK